MNDKLINFPLSSRVVFKNNLYNLELTVNFKDDVTCILKNQKTMYYK